MNYIAHAWVAGSEGLFAIGQLLGDFATRSELEGCESELLRGVEAHRELDRFVDCHEDFTKGCKILERGVLKYAPVVMDILMDHFLARHWSALNGGDSFEVSVETLYSEISLWEALLPQRMQKVAYRMRTETWLSGFPMVEGLSVVLYYLAKRTRKPQWINAAMPVIVKDYDLLERHCLEILRDKQLSSFHSKSFGLQKL